MTSRTYEEVVRVADLAHVGLIDARAQRVGNPEGSELAVRIEIESAHRQDGAALEFRFAFAFVVHEAENEVALIDCAYVVGFVLDDDETIEGEHARRLAEDVALMAAYPYAREFFQSMTARLDLGGVTLGLVRRGQFSIDTDRTKGDDALPHQP